VSLLGLGCGALGADDLDDDAAVRLVHAALDLGVTLFDTAPSYGRSEARLRRALAGRRDSVVLSTKGGYGVPDVPDWTGLAVTGSIDAALVRLGTDHLDLFHLHSCPREVLLRDDILGALAEARAAGKIRVAAYSGENEALVAALGHPLFGGVQCSVNVCDQRGLSTLAAAPRVGVLGKRALANACFRHASRPRADDTAVYWERFGAMGLGRWTGVDWVDATLRFAAFAAPVSAVLVGTRSFDHLREAADVLSRGPLTDDQSAALSRVFREHGDDWGGIV
jgi:aryl-alcohol dehydrogenase-like predicted oxidoreductase